MAGAAATAAPSAVLLRRLPLHWPMEVSEDFAVARGEAGEGRCFVPFSVSRSHKGYAREFYFIEPGSKTAYFSATHQPTNTILLDY